MMISVVVAHYHREKLLYRTLWAYRHLHTPEELKNVEFVIVDDDGGRSKTFWKVIKAHSQALNITAAGIDENTTNACIPLNFGVRLATGKILVLTNAENIPAVPNILSKIKAKQDYHPRRYISCGCYSLSQQQTATLKKYNFENKKSVLKAVRSFRLKTMAAAGSGREGWYNHSKYRPCHLYFLVAMRKAAFEAMGGFDEEFARGYAFEDADFTRRIRQSSVVIKPANSLYCFHQYHFNAAFRASFERRQGVARNSKIYMSKANAGIIRNSNAWGKPCKKKIVRRWHKDEIEKRLFGGYKDKRNNGALQKRGIAV